MKKLINLCALITAMLITAGCTKEVVSQNQFEFVKEYTAQITVGGIVGVEERTFEVGERYTGVVAPEQSIKIRIAEHTERNEDCPNPWCYQEFLVVPEAYLIPVGN